MRKMLESRTAIITGGGRGIGLAIAKSLSEAGANVVISDTGVTIDGADPDSSVASMAASQVRGPAISFTESVSTPHGAKSLVESAIDSFGQIDIIINNAAILRDSFIFK